jgi:hypothetical protein
LEFVGGIALLAIGILALVYGVLMYTFVMISIEEGQCTFSDEFVAEGPAVQDPSSGLQTLKGKSKCGEPLFGVGVSALGFGLIAIGIVAIIRSRKRATIAS